MRVLHSYQQSCSLNDYGLSKLLVEHLTPLTKRTKYGGDGPFFEIDKSGAGAKVTFSWYEEIELDKPR